MRISKLAKKTLVLAVLLGGLPLAAQATTVSGNGTKSCGDFVGYINTGDQAGADAFISWAQGFISAYNWANDQGRNVQIDPGGLTYLLVEYCGANPSKHFYDAVKDVIEQYR